MILFYFSFLFQLMETVLILVDHNGCFSVMLYMSLNPKALMSYFFWPKQRGLWRESYWSFKWCFQKKLFVVLSSWKNMKEKGAGFRSLIFFLHLSVLFSGLLLELLICRGSYQSSLRFMPIPNHSLPLFYSLLQAGLFFWPRANYIWESRRETSFGQERTKCWQVLLGSLNIYPK